MRKKKPFKKDWITAKISSGTESFLSMLVIIIFSGLMMLFYYYENDVDSTFTTHVMHSSLKTDRAVCDYLDDFLLISESGSREVYLITRSLHSMFSYTSEHKSVRTAIQKESAVCLIWSYIECIYLKHIGYKCWQLPETVRPWNKLPDHAVVCVLIEGDGYYIADPTNNLFLPAKDYLQSHQTSEYWYKRISMSAP